MTNKKNYVGLCIPKIWQILNLSLGHFIKHKPLISEECNHDFFFHKKGQQQQQKKSSKKKEQAMPWEEMGLQYKVGGVYQFMTFYINRMRFSATVFM